MKKSILVLVVMLFMVSLTVVPVLACDGGSCPLPSDDNGGCTGGSCPISGHGKVLNCDGGSCPLPSDDNDGGCTGGSCPLP